MTCRVFSPDSGMHVDDQHLADAFCGSEVSQGPSLPPQNLLFKAVRNQYHRGKSTWLLTPDWLITLALPSGPSLPSSHLSPFLLDSQGLKSQTVRARRGLSSKKELKNLSLDPQHLPKHRCSNVCLSFCCWERVGDGRILEDP